MALMDIVLISLGSGITTLILGVILFQLFLKKKMDQILEKEVEDIKAEFEKGLLETGEELIPEFRDALAEAFAKEAEEFLPEFRKEVSEGFLEAGEELLPEYREEVQAAFEKALVRVFSGKLVEKTALSVAKTGSSLVGTGLDILFGKKGNDDRNE